MMTYAFTIQLADVEEMTEDIANLLYDAGCDDGSPFSRCGQAGVHFDREAMSLEQAIGSAVKDVLSAGFKILRVELEPDDVLAAVAIA